MESIAKKSAWERIKRGFRIFGKFYKITMISLGILGSLFFFLYQRYYDPSAANEIISPQNTYDSFPIWLLRDGNVSVYRQMDFYEDGIEHNIVISSLNNKKHKNIEIYDRIPKEVAASASDVIFSVQPQIIEDDPLVKYSITLDSDKPTIIRYTIEADMSQGTGCKDKDYATQMIYQGLNPESISDCIKKWIMTTNSETVIAEYLMKETENIDKVFLHSAKEYSQYKDAPKKAIASKGQRTLFASANKAKQGMLRNIYANIKKSFSSEPKTEPVGGAMVYNTSIFPDKYGSKDVLKESESRAVSQGIFTESIFSTFLYGGYKHPYGYKRTGEPAFWNNSFGIHVYRFKSADRAENAADNSAGSLEIYLEKSSGDITVKKRTNILGYECYSGFDFSINEVSPEASFCVLDKYIVAVVPGLTAGHTNDQKELLTIVIKKMLGLN